MRHPGKNGVIKPESAGIPDVRLTGPFLVQSLTLAVDPDNPGTYGSLLWTKEKETVWFGINAFKGPFYLGAGETISAEVSKSPWVTIYSGCKLE